MSDYKKMTDRELDAMVHTRVMGEEPEIVWIARDDDDNPDAKAGAYIHTSRAFGSMFQTRQQIEDWIKERRARNGRALRLGKWEQYPDYSTDIAAAWKVVEKMRAGMFGYAVTSCGAEHSASFGKITEKRAAAGDYTCDSPSRAICIAALRAADAIADINTSEEGAKA